MRDELKPIKGRNRFCGPAAIASVLGVSTDHAAGAIRAVGGGKKITGVAWMHLVAALELLGARALWRPAEECYDVLSDWLATNLSRYSGTHKILIFGDGKSSHYGTICDERYQCNISREPVEFDAIPIYQERGTVLGVIEVVALPAVRACDPAKEVRRTLAKAKRLAARHDIRVETMLGGSGWYRVWCPELEHDDPFDGCVEIEGASAALARVEGYVDCLENGYLEAVTDPRFL